jgi:hypothetical protein
MRFLTLVAAATLIIASAQTAWSADAPVAKTAVTVFVSKGSASSVTKSLNQLHAKMEADGWVYRDMGVYTEDGDLQGIFVTYVRLPAGASP